MKNVPTLRLAMLFTILFIARTAQTQSTIFSENIGTPTGTTAIATYASQSPPSTFQNKGTLTYSNGGAANSADIRITSVSNNTGASGGGNVFFTTTSGVYGFSIENIDASNYTNLTLNYGYRKEASGSQANFEIDYWDGTAWQVLANTSSALFNEGATAATGWYAAKALSLPAAAQISSLKIRFLKSGTASIRIDDIILTGQVNTPATSSISPSSKSAGSPSFNLTVGGTGFTGTSVVTWNGSNRTTTFVSSTQLSATIPATDVSNAGTATVGVTTPGALASSNTQTFTINVAVGGTLTLTSSLPDFGNVCTNSSAVNSFTIDGNNLDGTDIVVGALNGFAYSSNSGGPFTSTLNITYAGSSLTGQVIYVQFNPTAVESYNGTITLSGGSISSYPVSATGSGVNTSPSLTTVAATNITPSSGTANGTITSNGCTGITGYGVEWSTTSGFGNGTGTAIAASNLSGNSFSVSLTGLTPNTRYYYHAYATNTAGTTYGAQQAFNAAPLPVAMASQPGFTYTQDFSDIATWGSFFVSGNGAKHFVGYSAAGTGTVPDPNVLTTSTSNFQGSTFLSSGGVQRGTDQTPPTTSIVLLSTGATDNTTSAAIDFFMDFTSVNAGTLSFDYASIDNGSGNRNASLRVYGSVDGTNWTEVTNVLNFTNFSPISGSKTNIQLPASFNNNANARLRFYFYNGTGGTTGSRPKISIDNLTVTAVATTPCSTPTAAPAALTFGTTNDVSISGSFTAASPAADHYIVIASVSNSLTGNPVDGTSYSVGDVVGEGTVVYNGTGTSFSATGLNASTTYYFFVFSYNGICTGGPLYYTTPLTGQQTTAAGLPPCTAPAGQASALQFGTTTSNSISGSFTATTADEYLVLVSTSSSLTNTPANGSVYSVGDVIGNGKVVSIGTSTSFTASSLNPSTVYYFYVLSLNSQNCVNGPSYNIISPLDGSQSTTALPPCATPTGQPSVLSFNASSNSISGAFDSGTGADHYLVVRSTSSTLSASPVDNTDYNTGDALGGGIVVGNVSGNGFLTTGLAGSTTYYFYIFSENSTCSGGTKYLATSPLKGNVTTSAPVTYNYYFGNWHSHSDYSDGNKDHPGYTPADDYAFAQTAQCMDYLGISEHNHYSTNDNPGNTITNYHQGPVQADNYTSTHTGFIAMYGMEWGVISGGGHVVVYGDGMNSLWGWESGSGDWGPTNNYDVYVAKSDYTGANGLFKMVNDNLATNTFATLAHPNNTDYNNLAGTAYNSVADNAIVGSAVESGPANSTNTTYSNPGSSMSYLSYFQTLLSKGYHLGPVVDHDNHNTTFGKTTYSRTAVIAPALNKTELVKGMRNMHFYATEDCDTKVDFTINTRMMGSLFTDRYAPIISVSLSDATTNTSSAVIKLMFGVPGSGVLPSPIATATGSSLNFVDGNLPNMSSGYYYVDITNGSARVVTTPIWYTRNDGVSGAPLPVKLESFTAHKGNSSIELAWKTAQEMNTKEFWIERSTNGSDYQRIGIVKAAGNSDASRTYNFTDGKPSNGDNFYRLSTVDLDTKYDLSKVLRINFSKPFTITISPNPASSYVEIFVANRAEKLNLEITDANGKVVKRQNITTDDTRINVTGLSKGFYVVRIEGASTRFTDKLIIQ